MVTELVPVNFSKIMQSKSYTVIVLGNEGKRFGIYTETQVGKMLQDFLTDEKRARPLTHDFLFTLFENLDIKVLQIIIQDLQDTIFFARVFLEQQIGEKKNILEIDARPSDAIILALMHNAPILCRKEIYDKAIPFCE